MGRRVCITGLGVISPIGTDAASSLLSLESGKRGIAPLRYLGSELRDLPCGEVPLSNGELSAELGLAAGEELPRTSLLGLKAAREAMTSAGLSAPDLREAAFFSGTTVGGMDLSEKLWKAGSESTGEYWDCASSTRLIAERLGRFSLVSTPSTACSSAANALILGARLIRDGRFDIVLAGGAESLSDYHLHGFNSLMITDSRPCRPFDESHAGLNLGEGAAYLVLESEEHAAARGACILAELSGWGNACDAFHQTATSPEGEGAFRAMDAAIRMAGLRPSDIDYVSAHGTGTSNNDETESAALRRIFGDDIPPFASTKGQTGHTTSASGSIEAAFCVLSLRDGILPGNAGFEHAPEGGLSPLRETLRKSSSHILCNAFGFGGNDSSLLLSRFRQAEAPGAADIRRRVFIRSGSQISLQKPLCDKWLTEPRSFGGALFLPADEPAYKEWIPPMQARRMGGLMKRAVTTAAACCGDMTPEAVISGTGEGCMENTERFLSAVCGREGAFQSPTDFMQSTHNTIGSAIAIRSSNHGYNCTWSHGDVSFESSLMDAFEGIASGDFASALVCGNDEMTPAMEAGLRRTGRLSGLGPAAPLSVSLLMTSSSEEALCEVSKVAIGSEAELWQDSLGEGTLLLRPEDYVPLFGDNPCAAASGVYMGAKLIASGRCDCVLVVGTFGDATSFVLLNRAKP